MRTKNIKNAHLYSGLAGPPCKIPVTKPFLKHGDPEKPATVEFVIAIASQLILITFPIDMHSLSFNLSKILFNFNASLFF